MLKKKITIKQSILWYQVLFWHILQLEHTSINWLKKANSGFLFTKQINRFHFAVTRPCCENNPSFILYCLLAFRPRIPSYTFVYSFVWSGIKSRFYKTAIFLTFNRSSVWSSRFFINCTMKASKYRFILPSNTFFCFPSLMTN